jgi:hypothetical protein
MSGVVLPTWGEQSKRVAQHWAVPEAGWMDRGRAFS